MFHEVIWPFVWPFITALRVGWSLHLLRCVAPEARAELVLSCLWFMQVGRGIEQTLYAHNVGGSRALRRASAQHAAQTIGLKNESLHV